MKEYAANAMTQDWFAHIPGFDQTKEGLDAFAEQVLGILEKPRSRRDGAERGVTSFPAFHPKYSPKP